jgi:hypothetical protein
MTPTTRSVAGTAIAAISTAEMRYVAASKKNAAAFSGPSAATSRPAAG